MRHTLHRYSTNDGKGSHMITLNDLGHVIKMFHYHSTQVDSFELRFWVFNNDLIADTPEHFREDLVYIDCANLLKTLRFEYDRMGYIRNREHQPVSQDIGAILGEARDHVLASKGKDLVNVLQMFQRNATEDLIGERELRKVLYEYLA